VGDALAALEQATAAVAAGEYDEVPGIAHAAGDMFTAVGAVTQHSGHGEMVPREAADLFDRASRLRSTNCRVAGWREGRDGRCYRRTGHLARSPSRCWSSV
jgi:hypothetical protein